MEIIKNADGNNLTIALVGRLDTTTAPQLEAEVKTGLEGVSDLVFDFENLEYISSAGLRVMLAAQKLMNAQGSMKVVNVCPEIKEVFDITGFSDFLVIE